MISRMTPLRGVVRADEDKPFFSPWEGDGSGGRPRRASEWSTLHPPEQQSLSRVASIAGSPGEMLGLSNSSYGHITHTRMAGRPHRKSCKCVYYSDNTAKNFLEYCLSPSPTACSSSVRRAVTSHRMTADINTCLRNPTVMRQLRLLHVPTPTHVTGGRF